MVRCFMLHEIFCSDIQKKPHRYACQKRAPESVKEEKPNMNSHVLFSSRVSQGGETKHVYVIHQVLPTHTPSWIATKKATRHGGTHRGNRLLRASATHTQDQRMDGGAMEAFFFPSGSPQLGNFLGIPRKHIAEHGTLKKCHFQ